MLGDLNDFQFSETDSILESAGLHDLIETLPLNEQYSYVFEGNSEALDHIMVSDPLFGRPLGSTRCTSTPSSPTRRRTTIRRSSGCC